MKHIDADKLRAGIESINLFPQISADYNDGREDMKMEVLNIIDSLQQDETQVDKMLCSQVWWEEQGWVMIPPNVTIDGIDSLLKQVRKKLQQEQPEGQR